MERAIVDVKRVAVVGGGNGGVTVAADLADRGYSVSLYEAPDFFESLSEIQRRGGVLLREKIEGRFTDGKMVKFSLVTSDIKEALRDAELIALAIPSFAVEPMARCVSPALKNGHMVLILGSDSLNAYRFLKTARDMGIKTRFRIGSASTLPYATRVFHDRAEVQLSLRDRRLLFAAVPSRDTDDMLSAIKKIYPHTYPAKNAFESTLDNGNPESHPGPCVLNAGRIDYSKGEFFLYREGFSEHTVNIVRAIDKERQAICRAFGFPALPKDVRNYLEGYFESTEAQGVPLHLLYSTSTAFRDIKGPSSLTHRYITEDIPMGLVLWSDMGKAAGVPTPAIDSVITLGGVLLDRDFRAEGLTLEKLGLGGLNVKELVEKVDSTQA